MYRQQDRAKGWSGGCRGKIARGDGSPMISGHFLTRPPSRLLCHTGWGPGLAEANDTMHIQQEVSAPYVFFFKDLLILATEQVIKKMQVLGFDPLSVGKSLWWLWSKLLNGCKASDCLSEERRSLEHFHGVSLARWLVQSRGV